MHEYINESLRHLAVPIDSIYPDPANERIHDEKNLAAIRQSIEKFGQHQVVTVWKEKNIVVAGNARHKVMKDLGYTHIAANIKSMTEVEAAALRVADNRTSELAYWKADALNRTVEFLKEEGITPDQLGFEENDLEAILNKEFLWEPKQAEESKSSGDEEKAERIVVSITDMTLRAPIRNAVLELIKANAWEDSVEVL